MSHSEIAIPSAPTQPRILLGRLLFALLAYLFLAAAGGATGLPNPRVPMAALFVLAMMLAWGVAPARSLIRWQWKHSVEGVGWIPVAVFAGVLFYALTFVARGTEGARIVGWNLSLEFVLLTGIAMPFLEEFLFRGVTIGSASGRVAWIAAVLSGICFAALHPDRWFGTFIFSLVAAAFYLRGGLGAAWGFHAAYNLSNYAALLFFSARNG